MVERNSKGTWFLRTTPKVLDALEARRIFLSPTEKAMRTPPGGVLLFQDTAVAEPYCALFEGCEMPTIGAFSYAHSALGTKHIIGRYCSIAAGVAWSGAHHPPERLSTSSFAFDPKRVCHVAVADAGVEFEIEPSTAKSRLPRLEHDVWIGDGAYIGKNVVLKTGCIVGARAVVTKSVEPYAIVAGNPARVVRMRFPDRLIADLLESRWWDYPYPQFAGMPVHDPERFLGQFHEAREQGRLEPIPPARPFLDIAREVEAEAT